MRPGYKQTDVGVIPQEWECTSVRRIASTARNAIVGGPFGSDLVSADYVDDDGVPVIRGTNMSGQWVSGAFVFVSPRKAKSLAANLARPGDIVFTQRGTLGQVSLVPDNPFESYLVSQSQMKLSVKREAADPLFFYYVFTSDDQQNLIRAGTIQTGVPHINLGILRDIPVQLPPIPEQRAIAAVLSDVDALLGALDRLTAKKRDLKQAAMQQLLTGRTRLPGFHGEWEVTRLGEVAAMGSGGTPPSSVAPYYDGDIPWVSISDMTKGGKVIAGTDRNLTFEGFRNSAAQMFPFGTVLYAIYASLGECSIAGVRLCSSQAILGIRPKDNLNGEFLYYFLTSVKSAVKALGQQGTQSNLNKGMVQDFRLSLPPMLEQCAIAEALAEMDAELASLSQRRTKTRALKQAMMQELLTGRTRLV